MRSPAGVLAVLEAIAIVVLVWLWLDARSELQGARPGRIDTVEEVPGARSESRGGLRPRAAGRTSEAGPERPEVAAASKPSGLREDVAGTWSPDDPLGIVVFGRLLDEAGHDLDGMIWFESDDFPPRSGSAEKDLHPYDIPGFVVRGLRPGTWRVRAQSQTYVPYEGRIELQPSPTRLRFDVVLKRTTITFVKFRTPEGEPLAPLIAKQIEEGGMHWRCSVSAVATSERPGPRFRLTERGGHELNDLGNFEKASPGRGRSGSKIEFPEGCDGYLATRVAPPFFASAVMRDEVLQTKEVAARGEVIVFTINVSDMRSRLSGLKLRVVDSARKPLPDVWVELNDRQSAGGNLKTKADGTAFIANSVPGLLILDLRGKGYAHLEQYVRLLPGQITDLGDVVLDPPAVIEGRMSGPDGKAAEGQVNCYFLDAMTSPLPLSFAGSGAQMEPTGRFHYDFARRGRYLVVGSQEALGTRAVAVDTSNGDVKGVDLTLGVGTKVTFEPSPADLDCLLQIRDSAGTLLSSRHLWTSTRNSMTLSPGTYSYSICDDDHVLRTRSLTVASTPLHLCLGE